MSKIFQEFLLRYNTFDIVLIFSFLIFAYITLIWIRNSRSNLPPGPIGLPIVGYIPFMKKYPYKQFTELGKKYGDVFSLQLGSLFVVILNSADAIREGYTKPAFDGRLKNNALFVSKKVYPFFKSEIHIWKEHRRVFMRTMKDLGYGKSRLEKLIQDEVFNFLAVLRRNNGRPTYPHIALTPSVANNIGALIFNETLDYENPERIELDKNFKLVNDALAQTAVRNFFPWLQFLPHQLFMTLKKSIQATMKNDQIYKKKIEQHKETLDPHNVRDYIDTYLLEMKSKKEKNQNTTLTEEGLLGSFSELQGAGSETTRNTILWGIYAMAAHQTAQRRIQEEIVNHIGPDRRPVYEDLKRMPYTQAAIMEVMRWKTLLPVTPMRCTTEDTTIRGYNIPKGTIVMTNLWLAHNDPKLWSNPDAFTPERFLSEDGLSVIKSPNLMPYLVGKRSCPGELMANIEVFLYLVSILQSFDVSFPQGAKPTFEGELKLTFNAQPNLVHFVARQH